MIRRFVRQISSGAKRQMIVAECENPFGAIG